MDGASIKQIGIASVLRSLFKGTSKHHIYKDLSNIVHSPDRNPHISNIYSDYTLSYNQSIDDKLYNYNKLLNISDRINDVWFDERTINNYNRTIYNPITSYVSPYRYTITPSIQRSSPKYKRSRSRSRSPPIKKRKRSSSSNRRRY
jgi:hypothetical protein